MCDHVRGAEPKAPQGETVISGYVQTLTTNKKRNKLADVGGIRLDVDSSDGEERSPPRRASIVNATQKLNEDSKDTSQPS